MYNTINYNLGYYRSPEKASWIYKSVKNKLFHKIFSEEMKTLEKFNPTKKLLNDFLNDQKKNFTGRYTSRGSII